MRDDNCPDCSKLTSGDCGKHSGTYFEPIEDRLKTLEDKIEKLEALDNLPIEPTVKEQYCEEAFTKADKINSVKLNIDCPKCHKHIEADVPAFRLEVTHPNYKEPTVKSNVAEVLDAYVNSVPSFKKKPKKYSLWGRKKDAIDYTQPTDKD